MLFEANLVEQKYQIYNVFTILYDNPFTFILAL